MRGATQNPDAYTKRAPAAWLGARSAVMPMRKKMGGMGRDVIGMGSDYALHEWSITLYHLTCYRICFAFLPSQIVIGLKSAQG